MIARRGGHGTIVEKNFDLSGELAKSLLDAAPDPTVIVDRAGTVVFMNTRTEDVFGYRPAELLGRPVESLMPQRFRASHPEHRERFYRMAGSRPMGAGLQLYGLHKDGREFPVEVSLSPLITSAGLLVSSAIRDVSAQRETERALAEADRAKSRLLAAASHDLRQPLQALSLLSRAAARKASDDPDLAWIVERQQNAVDSMSALLNSLLDISKLDSGMIRATAIDCSLQDVFQHLRSTFQEQAQEKNLELRVEDTELAAHTDPQLLAQLLSNLLSNAIRYTQEGEVRLGCIEHEHGLLIEVRDSGIGIPAEETGRIFDEFYQIGGDSPRPEGLGLGLSIVKRIAHLLDCPVNLESTPGRGSVFSILVPRGKAPLPAPDPAIVPPPRASGGDILIIDDEVAVAEATGMLLEIEGFQVQVAAGEHDALDCINRRRPDLIISDYHLRGATGITVVHRLRERLGARIPVVFISGDTSTARRAETLADAQHLTKPLSGEELLAAVHHGITRKSG